MNAPVWLEVAWAVFLLYGLISGWKSGLLKEICSTVGFVIGFLVAWHCHTHYRLPWGWTLLLCIALPIVLGFLASLVSAVINHIIIIGTINRLLGAILGCAKYGVFMYIIMLIVSDVAEWAKQL